MHRKKILVTFLFLIISSFITSCAQSQSKFGIVFSTDLDGNQDLYRMVGPNFQSIERLTFTPNDPKQDILVAKSGDQILSCAVSRSRAHSF